MCLSVKNNPQTITMFLYVHLYSLLNSLTAWETKLASRNRHASCPMWPVCDFVCLCMYVYVYECVYGSLPAPPPTSTYKPVGQLPHNLAYQWILLQYRNSYESTFTNNNIADERTWLFVQQPLHAAYSENPPNKCLCLDSEITQETILIALH